MDIGLLINGEDTPASTGGSFQRYDPVTGEVATRAAAACPVDVEKAAASATEAFDAWSRSTPRERRDMLSNAANIMSAKVDEFTAFMITETGATGAWAAFDGCCQS